MRKILALLAGGLVTAATLFSGPVAFADEPPTCADALTSFQDASKAADAALAADKAAEAAKVADDASADAAAAVDAARAAALTGGVSTGELADSSTLRARKAVLVAKADRTPAENDELILINAKLKLIDAFVAATTKAAAAKVVADATDADALRREAGKTDVDVLVKKAIDLRTVANDACKGTPGVTVTPLPPAPVVTIPVPTSINSGRA